jgi:hypothetical protein
VSISSKNCKQRQLHARARGLHGSEANRLKYLDPLIDQTIQVLASPAVAGKYSGLGPVWPRSWPRITKVCALLLCQSTSRMHPHLMSFLLFHAYSNYL